MSHVQKLRVFASQRLNEALEQILEAFEKTIVKYEEEAALNREVISRQHALLCALNNPLMTDKDGGVFTQQQLFGKDVPSNHQNRSQDVVSQPSHVQQKQGEQDLEEVEIIEFTYNSNNSKNPRHNFEASAEPGSLSQNQNGSIELSSETEDSDDYSKDSAKPASENPEGHSRPKDGFSCLSCNRTYTARRFLFRHVRAHIQDAKKVCGLCGEHFEAADDLKRHHQTHSRTRKNQIQVRTRSRQVRLQQLSEVHQNKTTVKSDDSSKFPERKLRGRPKKNKPGKDDPAENKKRKRKT